MEDSVTFFSACCLAEYPGSEGSAVYALSPEREKERAAPCNIWRILLLSACCLAEYPGSEGSSGIVFRNLSR